MSRVVDIITSFLKDLSEERLENILDFTNKLQEDSESEVFGLVKNKLRSYEIFTPLKNDINKQLSEGPWKLPLGDRKEEKIVLIILVSTLHYSKFILSYVAEGRDKVREYLQSVNEDERRDGVLNLQQSGNDTYKKTKASKSDDYSAAIADYSKALKK